MNRYSDNRRLRWPEIVFIGVTLLVVGIAVFHDLKTVSVRPTTAETPQ